MTANLSTIILMTDDPFINALIKNDPSTNFYDRELGKKIETR